MDEKQTEWKRLETFVWTHKIQIISNKWNKCSKIDLLRELLLYLINESKITTRAVYELKTWETRTVYQLNFFYQYQLNLVFNRSPVQNYISFCILYLFVFPKGLLPVFWARYFKTTLNELIWISSFRLLVIKKTYLAPYLTGLPYNYFCFWYCTDVT